MRHEDPAAVRRGPEPEDPVSTHANDAAPVAAATPASEPVEMVGSDAARALEAGLRSSAEHGAPRTLADLRDVTPTIAVSLSVGVTRA
jgi:hypothetical protein